MTWERLGLPSSLQNPSQSTKLWHSCLYVVSRSGDKCGTGAWVVFDIMNATMLGRISHILAPTDVPATKNNAMAVIELFKVKSSRTHHLDMPVITSSHSMQIVPTANIIFAFNAQHDCRELRCRMVSAGTYERQERLPTNRPQNIISHNPEPRYLINLHSLYNPHLIREVLPRDLVKPIPYLTNRIAAHNSTAARLRVTGPKRRAEAIEKARRTREANAQRLLAGKEIGGPDDENQSLDEELDVID
ncbi:hypothetical protein MPER_09742 [Moniliophthora perniciosa FA553]|nr:hypothetical protein MPER_09742 [Moniliophthora perniciosa FA553]